MKHEVNKHITNILGTGYHSVFLKSLCVSSSVEDGEIEQDNEKNLQQLHDSLIEDTNYVIVSTNKTNYDESSINVRQNVKTNSRCYDNNNHDFKQINEHDDDTIMLVKLLGKGAYGEVWLAKNLTDQDLFALKIFNPTNPRDGINVPLLRELLILKMFSDHDNIVKCKFVKNYFPSSNSFIENMTYNCFDQEQIFEPRHFELSEISSNSPNDIPNAITPSLSQISKFGILYVGFELCPYDLQSFLDTCSSNDGKIHTLTLNNIRLIAADVLNALDYLHSNGVLHRDIKAANILISFDGRAKLADFGLSRFQLSSQINVHLSHDEYENIHFIESNCSHMSNCVVTLWYRSPELLLGAQNYNYGCDTWSLGCVLFYLLTRKHLFQGVENELAMIKKLAEYFGPINEKVWPTVAQMPHYEQFKSILNTDKKSNYVASTLKSTDKVLVDFILNCLTVCPAKRPTAHALLNHPFLKQKSEPIKLNCDAILKKFLTVNNISRIGFSDIDKSRITNYEHKLFTIGSHQQQLRNRFFDKMNSYLTAQNSKINEIDELVDELKAKLKQAY